MWQRRTFHECALELTAISEDFRAAHTGRAGWDRPKRDQVMLEASQRGVELLRILALSIRGDQDHGLTLNDLTTVGALRRDAAQDEAAAALRDYLPPYSQLAGFTSIGAPGVE